MHDITGYVDWRQSSDLWDAQGMVECLSIASWRCTEDFEIKLHLLHTSLLRDKRRTHFTPDVNWSRGRAGLTVLLGIMTKRNICAPAGSLLCFHRNFSWKPHFNNITATKHVGVYVTIGRCLIRIWVGTLRTLTEVRGVFQSLQANAEIFSIFIRPWSFFFPVLSKSSFSSYPIIRHYKLSILEASSNNLSKIQLSWFMYQQQWLYRVE
jgi:hypothetical protein